MHTMRKALVLLSMVAMLSTLVVSTAFAGQYNDVPADAYYYTAVEGLAAAGVLDTAKESYNPTGALNRAEAAALLVQAAGLEGDVPTTATFVDVPTSHWAFEVVETAFAHGVVSGYSHMPGHYGPGDTVTREQYAKMAVEAFAFPEYTPTSPTFPDVTEEMWSYGYVETAYYYGVINGKQDGTFAPTSEINRADGAVITYQAMNPTEPAPVDPVDPVEPCEGDDCPVEPPSAGGDLQVSLGDTIDGNTLPSGATSVKMVNWDFTAGDEDATLKSLSVHRFGVSALPAGLTAYLYEGTDRLTSGKSVNGTTNIVTFNGLNLDIDAGETRTLTLKMDTGTVGTTGEIGFEIEDADAVDAGDGEVSVSGSLAGEMFGLSTTAAGTATIEKNGTIVNPKVGEDDATIAKFKIGVATEAATIEQLGLLVTGTISNDAVENFELYVSGEDDPIATVESLNSSDIAMFVLETPYEIPKGSTKSFWMKADFNTGRSGDTVFVYVDETTDILAVGGTYGYGMNVVINTDTTGYDGITTTCTASAGTCSYSTLQGGDVTVTSGGPSAATVGIGDDDIHLMNFSIVSVSAITVKNLPVYLWTNGTNAAGDTGLLYLSGTTATSAFTDIKIINTDTNETVMGPIDSSSLYTGAYSGALSDTNDDDGYYLFADEFTMEAGEELKLALVTDVANTTDIVDTTIYGALQLGGTYPQMKDVNNKTIANSTSLVPNASITGKTMTLSSPGLTTSLASVPVAVATSTNNPNTYVKGQDDVKFTGITAKCGTASDCTMTDIALTGYYDADDDGTFAPGTEGGIQLNAAVGSVWIADEAGTVITSPDGTKSTGKASVTATTGAVTFDNLNYTIEAGTTEVLYITGKIEQNATAGDNIAFSLASGGITFEDGGGTARTSTGAVNGTTAPTTCVTVSAGGTLTISVDDATPREDIVMAGTSGNEIAKYKFTSTLEPFTVKALSISNRQSGVATANLGDYANNVSKVTISYTDSAGETKTQSTSLDAATGIAEFTGMTMHIGKDDDAVLTVSADLPTVSNGAQVGEFVDLNIALNNFEASGSTGSTYKADELDASSALLSVGTITFVDSSKDIAANQTETKGTSTATVTVPDLDVTLPVGTLVKFGAASTTYTAASEPMMVLTSVYTDGGLTLTGLIVNDAEAAADNVAIGDSIAYALPATGYLSDSRQMHVYETKPTITLDSSSPSGSRSVTTSDNAFVFNVAAGSQEKVQWRTAKELATCAVGDDQAGANNTVDATYTTVAIDGSGCQMGNDGVGIQDGDTFTFDAGATGVINQYARASFWMYWAEADNDGDPLFADFAYGTTDANDDQPGDNLTALAASDCTFAGAATATTLTTGTWYHCDVAIHADTAAADRYFFFEFSDVDAAKYELADTFVMDRVILYNDKITIDMEGDDIDTYANMQTNAANGTLPAYLKEGGDTLATGYVYKNTSAAAEGGTASVTFYPISGEDSAISISKGTSKTITLQLSTSALLHEDASAEDPLTFAFDLGTASNGAVTAGDIWWNDTNFASSTAGSAPGSSYALTTPGVIKWLGKVTNTRFTSETVKY